MGNKTAVSLFSGAGGMDVGFNKAEYNVLFANDIDPTACKTYNLNHEINSHCGDIRDFHETLIKYKGVDIVFGGPPCQGFSVAGKMNPEDERSKLIWEFLTCVDLVNPTAFVCENVKNLAVNNRWQDVRRKLHNKAHSMGYSTALILLNAAEYGVPQARERMFFIGIKEKLIGLNNAELQAYYENAVLQYKKKPETISQLIYRLGPAGQQSNDRTCSAIITYAKNPILRKSPYAGMLFNGAGRPLNPQGVSLTLPASMGGNRTPIIDEDEIFLGKNSFIEEYHRYLKAGNKPKDGTTPNRLRRLTVDEALAIQTFPSNYLLSGTKSAMYRQIGNAVPCNLAEVIARCTKDILAITSKKENKIFEKEIA